MKTQLSILFKNNPFTTGHWLWSKISLYFDGNQYNPIVLKSNSSPQLIEITPGPHKIYFKYHNDDIKIFAKLIGLFYGFVFGLLIGVGGLLGDIFSGLYGFNKTYENTLECYLNEGDTLRISLHPKMNGKVKVKLLDK